jgi:hypothetical protein
MPTEILKTLNRTPPGGRWPLSVATNAAFRYYAHKITTTASTQGGSPT